MTTSKKVLGAPFGSIPIAHQPGHVEMQLRKGEYFQMDGEPWVLNTGCTAIVEPNMRVRMLCPVESGTHGVGFWSGKQKRSFWGAQLRTRSAHSSGVELSESKQ